MPKNVPVTCKACESGEYSDSLSFGSCKPCSKCLPDEAIVAKCTNVSDTRCSCKPCPRGYYRNKTISKCLPCSSCCFVNDTNEVVPQCVSQGLPRSQVCSNLKRKPCDSVKDFVKSSWGLNNWTLVAGFLVFILISYFAYTSILPRKNNLATKVQCGSYPSHETTEHVTPQQKNEPETTEDTYQGEFDDLKISHIRLQLKSLKLCCGGGRG